MKQKVVIKVSLNGRASGFCCFGGTRSNCSKALKLAGGFPGVQSMALVGDQDKIEVTGEVDPVKLATLLRNEIGHADIVSVGEVKKEEEEKKDKPVPWLYPRHEIIYIMDR